ncbi:MAG TPA: hypothetical protein VNB90_15100 [Cytophagaceae bacterium]|jgi:hypothetical protein|nr:hypothetical protein [Cytophagaceae bacterium]
MMDEVLGKIADSEYSNAAELFGLDGDEAGEELLGAIKKMPLLKRAKVLKNLFKPSPGSKGSRAEMEKFMVELPDHIKQGLGSNKLKFADHTVYSIKAVNGAKTIKMFEPQDVKEVGLTNISNGRLPKNSALLVSGIFLLQGVAATITSKDDIKSTIFSGIDTVGAFATGEFTLKANKKSIVDSTSNNVFKTSGFNAVPVGFYKLSNPRLIQDDVDIEMEIDLGTLSGINANAVLYVGLYGTVTIP